MGVPFTIACNNRKVLSHLICRILGLVTIQEEEHALILLDKLDKQGPDSIVALFAEQLQVPEPQVRKLLSVLTGFRQAEPSSLLEYFDTKASQEEWARFQQTITILQELAQGSLGKFVINLSIARGLAYYTGIVYETTVDGVQGFGSISSGGRYDNLAARFSNQVLPGVGGSIGVDRLTALLSEKEACQKKAPTEVFVAIATDDVLSYAFKLVKHLRDAGIATDLALRNQKLGAQFKTANKLGFAWVVTVGDEEKTQQIYSLKNMATGAEEKLSLADLLAKLR